MAFAVNCMLYRNVFVVRVWLSYACRYLRVCMVFGFSHQEAVGQKGGVGGKQSLAWI